MIAGILQIFRKKKTYCFCAPKGWSDEKISESIDQALGNLGYRRIAGPKIGVKTG